MDEETIGFLKILFTLTVLTILIIGAVEAIMFVYSLVNADKIECTFLWCTFTTVRSNGTSSIVSTRDCYENGVRINCSDMDNDVWGFVTAID